jgi:hypothetical protein
MVVLLLAIDGKAATSSVVVVKSLSGVKGRLILELKQQSKIKKDRQTYVLVDDAGLDGKAEEILRPTASGTYRVRWNSNEINEEDKTAVYQLGASFDLEDEKGTEIDFNRKELIEITTLGALPLSPEQEAKILQDMRKNAAAKKIQEVYKNKKNREKSQKSRRIRKQLSAMATAGAGAASAPPPPPSSVEEKVEVSAVDEKTREAAATKIQTATRSMIAKKELQARKDEKSQRVATATAVQSAWRGKKGRDTANKLKEEKAEKEQETAATKIQSMARMKEAKNKVREIREEKAEKARIAREREEERSVAATRSASVSASVSAGAGSSIDERREKAEEEALKKLIARGQELAKNADERIKKFVTEKIDNKEQISDDIALVNSGHKEILVFSPKNGSRKKEDQLYVGNFLKELDENYKLKDIYIGDLFYAQTRKEDYSGNYDLRSLRPQRYTVFFYYPEKKKDGAYYQLSYDKDFKHVKREDGSNWHLPIYDDIG